MSFISSRLCASIVVLGLLSGLARGQRAEAPPSFDLRQAHGGAVDDAGVPRLFGHDYEAAFADGAMHFVPALGKHAARSDGLTFRLQSIRRGHTTLLSSATDAAPPPTLVDRQVRFEHAAAVECYDARPDGVEQSFVFRERPAGEGDLIVRGAITTALRAEVAGAALCFTDGAIGGVRIGEVIGIDAAGRCCAGSSTFADGVLELRLPAAFVDTASYPLTLDPLFGTLLLPGGTGFDDDEVDAAYDSSHDVYLVVWTRTFSASDRSVRAQRVDASGALLGSLLAVTSGAVDDLSPAVASVNARNRFVVCWQSGTGPFGPYDIHCRTVAASDGSLGAVALVDAATTNDLMPAICGNRDPIASDAVLAWTVGNAGVRSHEVTVTTTGAITLGTTHVVSSAGNVVAPPELPKARRPGDMVLAAWVEQTLFFVIRARALDASGVPLGTAASVDSLQQDSDIAMDGDGSSFLLVHDNGVQPNAAVRARPITWDGSNLVVGAVSTLPSTGNPRGYELAFLGERYLLAWQQPTANPFDDELRITTIKPDCTPCSQTGIAPTISRPNQRLPVAATRFAADIFGPFDEALLLWNETDAAPPFHGNVVGQLFTAMLAPAPAVLSAGCPGGGTAGVNGPFALGNSSFRFTLTGGDPTAPLALLSLAVAGGAPLACGCQLTQPLVTAVAPANAGAAQFALVPPCDPTVVGFQLEFQVLLFGTAASPCPLLANVSGSDRVLLTLGQ